MRERFAVPACALLSLVAWAAGAKADLPQPEGGEIQVEADRLTLMPEGDRVEAAGSVHLEAGQLRIDADSLAIDLDRATGESGAPLTLRYGELSLSARRLRFDAGTGLLQLDAPRTASFGGRAGYLEARSATCKNGLCTLDAIRGSACPHQPPGYEIRADRATVLRSGDVDLRRPALLVEDRVVAKLPWIRLRRPGASGFLAPRLGFTREGGLIAGPAGQLPLSQGAAVQGYVAARTAEGLETGTRILSRDWQLSLDHIADLRDEEGHTRLRARGSASLDPLSIAIDGDVSTDRKLIDERALDPIERAITHTATRGLLSAAFRHFVVEASVDLIEAFDDRGRFAIDLPTPGVAVALSVPSAPVADLLWPSLDVRFSRYGLDTQGPVPGADGQPALSHTRLELAPRIDLPLRIGPVPLVVFAATRHELWLLDDPEAAKYAVHLAAFGAALEAPLARSYPGFRHVIDPFLRYRITPWMAGDNPPWIVDDFDRLERGEGLEAGLAMRFDRMQNSPAAELELAERVDLPGFGRSLRPAYLYGRGAFGPAWLRWTLDAAWDHREARPSLAGIRFSSEHRPENRIELGGRWIGPGRGPHQDRPYGDAPGPWLVTDWVPRPEARLELFEALNLALTRRVGATVGARVGVWPERALHALWYGLKIGSFCGCLGVEVVASHRLASPVPDIWVNLRVAGI